MLTVTPILFYDFSNLDVQIYNCFDRKDIFKVETHNKNIRKMPKICADTLSEKNTNVPVVENATIYNIQNEENVIYVCKNCRWIKNRVEDLPQKLNTGTLSA